MWLVVEKGPFFVRCTIFLATSRCCSLHGSYFQHLHNLACLFLFCAYCQDAKFRQCERGELLTHSADIDLRINITNMRFTAVCGQRHISRLFCKLRSVSCGGTERESKFGYWTLGSCTTLYQIHKFYSMEWDAIWKEVVVAYMELLILPSPEETEKKRENYS